jgi:hypothetical protein
VCPRQRAATLEPSVSLDGHADELGDLRLRQRLALPRSAKRSREG